MIKYESFNYVGVERWGSYWYQAKEVMSWQPQSVLEVGVGNKTVYNYLRERGIAVTGIDIDPELRPDVVGNVLQMPFSDGQFDIVLCAEVLEHLPFEDLPPALGEIRRVARRGAIITLPHWGRHFSIDLRVPLVRRLRFQFKVSFPAKRHPPGGPHEWEIGKKGYPLSRILGRMRSARFATERHYVIFEMPYHHLFVLSKS
jgi:SAM-dependent methyltransferase